MKMETVNFFDKIGEDNNCDGMQYSVIFNKVIVTEGKRCEIKKMDKEIKYVFFSFTECIIDMDITIKLFEFINKAFEDHVYFKFNFLLNRFIEGKSIDKDFFYEFNKMRFNKLILFFLIAPQEVEKDKEMRKDININITGYYDLSDFLKIKYNTKPLKTYFCVSNNLEYKHRKVMCKDFLIDKAIINPEKYCKNLKISSDVKKKNIYL